jgi:hypothetical protein
MTQVHLPPGCIGFDAKDGTRYTAKKAGGTVNVDERHAKAINEGQFGGDANLVTAKGGLTFGTKKGRECPKCRRVWNVWNAQCPKCGEDTVEWLR